MTASLDLRKVEIQELSGSLTTWSDEKPNQIRLAWHATPTSEAKELVLLDPKDYGNADDATGSKVYGRVKDLAGTLHSLEIPHILKCKGWYEDQATAQFYFVYHLPSECESQSGGAEFLSLYEAFKIVRPSVGARMRLALSLAETVGLIHENGWLHKGVQSRHVLFFPSRPGGRPNLEHPRLVGFDYARREGPRGYSEKPM